MIVDVAQRLADDLLAPAAEDTDTSARVPRDRLEALAATGLFGIAGPAEAGGLDLDPATSRRVLAAIGGGCGATFFVWVQHHSPVRALAASDNRALADELLGDLCAGRSIAGVAFAHARRRGEPAVTATRVAGGWRIDGRAPWATSWGIADWFSVAAVTADDELVWAMVPAGRDDRVAAVPLRLPVFGATGTVELRFDGRLVDDERVISVEDLARWREVDRRRAAIGQPAVLGVTERAIRLLRRAGDAAADETGDRLASELGAAWRRDDELTAELGGSATGDTTAHADVVVEASNHRAGCLSLARRATTALLAASGGGGMSLDHPAQRLAREVDFYVVQAQTADGRAATLRSV